MADQREAKIPAIPPEALSGMEGWEATVVWWHDPRVITWRFRAPHGEIRYLKLGLRDQSPNLTAERDRMAWAATWLPVPRVLGFRSDGEHAWLLTSGLGGVTAIDEEVRADPAILVARLADGLRRFHALPVKDCPFSNRLDVAMPAARARLAGGLIDPAQDFHPEHRELSAEAALDRLEQLRPDREDLVVCHGDYCLPNVLISDGLVSGYLDIGGAGVADRWWDLAIATWSVTWNLGPGWEDAFLDAYGIGRDPAKVSFYRLLYDLIA